MSINLQIVFIIASIFTLVFIIKNIRKHQLNIDDSIIWILWSLLLLILSMFPSLSQKISSILGFQSSSNFILSLFIFFLYIMTFFQTIKLSLTKEKVKMLTQKLSIYIKEEQEKKK